VTCASSWNYILEYYYDARTHKTLNNVSLFPASHRGLFTENSWWPNKVYLVIYSKFAPHLSPTTWRISKHSARSENHTKPINRFSGQNPGIFLYSNTWKHGRTVTASRYVDCLLFSFVNFNDHFRRKPTRVSAHKRLHPFSAYALGFRILALLMWIYHTRPTRTPAIKIILALQNLNSEGQIQKSGARVCDSQCPSNCATIRVIRISCLITKHATNRAHKLRETRAPSSNVPLQRISLSPLECDVITNSRAVSHTTYEV